MARTYKDRPPKFKTFSEWGSGRADKPKKKKQTDTEHHWMTTPGWWIRLFMNRPERRQSHLLEHLAETSTSEALEELDALDLGKKPHKYYW